MISQVWELPFRRVVLVGCFGDKGRRSALVKSGRRPRILRPAGIHQLAEVPVERPRLELAAALGAFPHGLDDARSVQVLFGQRQQDVKHGGLQTQVTFDFALFPAFGCASDLRCHRTGGTRDEARYRNPPSRSSPYPLMARVGSGSFPSKSEGRP